MNFLEQRILAEGVVKPGNVLKVDTFLNHQVDMALVDEIGREFVRRFAGKKVNKVLTIDADGDTAGDGFEVPDRQAAGQGVVAGGNGNTGKLAAGHSGGHREAIGHDDELTAGSNIGQTGNLNIGIGCHGDAGQQAQTQNQGQCNRQKTLNREFHK